MVELKRYSLGESGFGVYCDLICGEGGSVFVVQYPRGTFWGMETRHTNLGFSLDELRTVVICMHRR